MPDAYVSKCVVLEDKEDGGTVVMGVAEHQDDMINFKAKYDWETMDYEGFAKDMRDKLAEGFGIPVGKVMLNEKWMLDKMEKYHKVLKSQKRVQ